VVIAVPAEREHWARRHADMIAREILATTFEFGEPADASDIGDGVRVAIARA
jgi:isoleucyl-tRNA synthetase